MILDMFVLFQVFAIAIFFLAFYTKQELFWFMSIVMSSIMMINSWNVEVLSYVYNNVTTVYDPTYVVYYYPYLMGINLMFLGLSIIYSLYDIFDHMRQQ